MYDHTFLNLQITSLDIRPHIKWAVTLVIFAYGHFNLPQGFVWICMGLHTHFITPEGMQSFQEFYLSNLYIFRH